MMISLAVQRIIVVDWNVVMGKAPAAVLYDVLLAAQTSV
jgi:hypothetical protein